MEINPVIGNTAKGVGPSDREDAALRKACSEFEAIFTAYLLKKMRDTVPRSDFFGSGQKEEIFQTMLDQEVSNEIAGSGAMSLGDLMYAQLAQQAKNRSSIPEDGR